MSKCCLYITVLDNLINWFKEASKLIKLSPAWLIYMQCINDIKKQGVSSKYDVWSIVEHRVKLPVSYSLSLKEYFTQEYHIQIILFPFINSP